jgi:uncharacterized protein with GYD domain
MASYLLLGKYSQEGMKGISSDRTVKATELIKSNGGTVKAGYMLLGEVDIVLILDLPNTEAAMKVSMGLSKLLGIAFTTSPAITVEEFDKLT